MTAPTSFAEREQRIEQARISFGEVQSFLAELDGLPLISSNWSGHFRPYVYRNGKFVELIKLTPNSELDLYNPTPISSAQVVLAGSESGSRDFDLFLYNRGIHTLTNLTNTPGLDEGDFCVIEGSALIAYRQSQQERFARLKDGQLHTFAGDAVPGFNKCIWLKPHELYGAHRVGIDEVELYRCQLIDENARCFSLSASLELVRFVDFFKTSDGRLGVLGVKRGTKYRRPYVLSEQRDQLIPVLSDPPLGDVVEYDPRFLRIGLHGHYRSSLATDPAVVVFTARKIGGEHYAIAATKAIPKTLAKLQNGKWVFQRPLRPPTRLANQLVEEISLLDGGFCPAVYFGTQEPSSAILWLHGGPRENVSPRFNPYFDHLTRHRHGVLALNYPGSVGWGLDYESSFDEAHLAKCLQAAVEFLQARGIQTVVSWSISTGAMLQRILLRHAIPISGMIDQAGFGNTDLRAITDLQHLPYLSIRGDHDLVSEGCRIDFWYQGGHDVTHYKQFALLLERVDDFLSNLNRIGQPGPIGRR